MNAIAPHGPPIQNPSGQLPPGGGRKDDPPFGDFLSGDRHPAIPSPIADHSPPASADEPDADEPTGQAPPPRPMRWKGGKAPAADAQEPAAGTIVPLLPAPPDLRAIVPGVTLTGNWARPITNPENSEEVAAAGGAEAPGAPGGSAGIGGASPMRPVGLSPLPPATGGPADVRRSSLVERASNPNTSREDQPAPVEDQPMQPDMPPAWASSPKQPPPVSVPGTGQPGGSPIAIDSEEAIATVLPTPKTDQWPVKLPPVGADEPVPGLNPAANHWPVKQPPVDADEPTPALDPAPPPEISSSVRIISTDVPPAATATTAQPTPVIVATTAIPMSDNQAELSPGASSGEAKIAAASKYAAATTRDEKISRAQSTVRETVTPQAQPVGMTVAKEPSVVTTTLPNLEDEPVDAPVPKRTGGPFGGAPASGRSGSSPAQVREAAFLAVSGPTDPGATPAQIAAAPAPEPTAARHAVRVETLLQNALSAGQSLRPNGQEQTEMRVRLGDGSEDVTIRLQVANDRMQVTFQTNSPEMRKALEYGWEQFSASAARSSTLALATPRFEVNTTGTAQQGTPTDAQAFSFNQQNSRRQDSRDASPDEGILSSVGSRSAVSTDKTDRGTSVATPNRRWTGWA